MFDVEKTLLEFLYDSKQPVECQKSRQMLQLQDLLESLKITVPKQFNDINGGFNRMLQKFLRVSKNKPKAALNKIKGALALFEQYPVISDEAGLKEYRLFLEKWPMKFSGISKRGHLVQFFPLQDIRPGMFKGHLKDKEVKRCFVQHSIEAMKLQNYCNYYHREFKNDQVWSRAIQIYDMEGYDLSKGLKELSNQLKVNETLFPDSVERVFFINAPKLMRVYWGLLSRIFGKKAKTFVTVNSGNCMEELVELIGSEELVKSILSGQGKKSFEHPLEDIDPETTNNEIDMVDYSKDEIVE